MPGPKLMLEAQRKINHTPKDKVVILANDFK